MNVNGIVAGTLLSFMKTMLSCVLLSQPQEMKKVLAVLIFSLHIVPTVAQSTSTGKQLIHRQSANKQAAKKHPSARPMFERNNPTRLHTDIPSYGQGYWLSEMPAFEGDLRAFLDSNLRYPDSARANGIAGKAYI